MELRIYIDRIRDGQSYKVTGKFPTAPLLPHEPELSFSDTLALDGEAYLAGDHLVIQLKAEVTAFLPCSICNEATPVQIELSDFYHTMALEEIKGNMVDFSDLVREELLLELPKFTECAGNCPNRADLQKYLQQGHQTESYTPFSQL